MNTQLLSAPAGLPRPAQEQTRRTRNRRPTAAIVLALALTAAAMLIVSRMRAASAVDSTQYKVGTVSLGTVRKTVSTTGILEPWSTVSIKSKAGGRVDALLVDVGSVVHKNQIIAKIDPTDTMESVQTAQAAIDGAIAHTQQAKATYSLQADQSGNAVTTAQEALRAAIAARTSSAAQLSSAEAQAKAQPVQTRAAIAQAKANYDAAVKQREALDATNPQDQASAQSTYDQAAANQQAAKDALDRQTSLAKQGFVAQQTVDTAQASYAVYIAQSHSAQAKLNTIKAQQSAAVEAADAQVAAAKAALATANAGQVDIATKNAAVRQVAAALKQADAQVASARLALSLAKANLANVGIKAYDVTYNQSQVASNQATLTNAKTTLTQTVVRAPSDGVVITKDVSEGTYITSGVSLNSTGTDIVQIADLSRMYVQATVDETDIADVKSGQSVDVHFDAYPDIDFKGSVVRIEPQAVVNSNVTQFNVRVEIDNKSANFKLLKPGMNSTCDFILKEKTDILAVPSAALHSDGPGSYVLVATGGHAAPADPASAMPADPNTLVGVTVRKQTVQIGIEGDNTTEITSGLHNGDQIVLQTVTPAPMAEMATKSAIGGGMPGPPSGGVRGGAKP